MAIFYNGAAAGAFSLSLFLSFFEFVHFRFIFALIRAMLCVMRSMHSTKRPSAHVHTACVIVWI